ncbi:major capsid protein [Pseudomonas otitidis]|uniref:major capsid protein n=1 Tax=Metapseudomonas otitidis TaxID=319939 RepID=UPI0024ACB7C4|nr:major capsid protein [Pseudomonas otitidis]MDI6527726.1 major capsid protein [Pseudomonas otitidis]
MDIFETRTMMEAVEQMPKARRFLLNTFFGAMPRTFPTRTVDIDIVKGKRKMAPFVHPRMPGSVVLREGMRTDTYAPPYVQPKMETTAELIFKRSPGDNPYITKPPAQRAAEQLGKDLVDLDDQIARREEWMCAQALSTGQIRVVGEGVDDTIDFLMSSDHRITLTTGKWNAAGSTPLTDLRGWKRKISQDSGRTAGVGVMGANVVDAFLDNEQVAKRLHNRRVEIGLIKPDELPDGVTYLGYLNDPGLDLYSYDEWFIDDDGQEKPMVPVDSVLIGSTSTRNGMLYGAIQDLDAVEGGMVEAARFPKSWKTDEPSARWLKLQTSPLPGFVEPDAFLIAKVI